MNPRSKLVKVKIIGVIFVDVVLFFLLVLASSILFSIPSRAEDVAPTPDNSAPNLISAILASFADTTVSEINNPEGKVFVCKYVGTPGIDERLQTGDNPISTSISAIPNYQGIGSWFADEQGRSYVIVEDVGQPEPPVSDCPPPVAPPPPTASFTATFTSTPTDSQPPTSTATSPTPTTATPTPTETAGVTPDPTATSKPSATNTLVPSPTTKSFSATPTATSKPSATNTLVPSPTTKSFSATPTATSRPSATNTLVPSPTTKAFSASPTATALPEVITCPTCSIAKDFRELIVGGLYTASLLNSQDKSSTLKVSITLYDGYKGKIVGETIYMVDTQSLNKVMQVAIPLWCINPITKDVYWIHTVASAQKASGEIWFATDEWVQINLSN